jgi:hypothetical protein
MLATVQRKASNIEKLEAELSEMDTEKLKAELARSLAISVENLTRAAIIIGIIESRGEDLSALKLGLIQYLRKIACGQLLPEVVARFIGHPALKRIAVLPIPDQKRCLNVDGLQIGVLVNGNITHRFKPILLMEAFEVQQVFASDHIRDVEEQVRYVRSRDTCAATVRPIEPVVEVPTWQIEGHKIRVNRPVELTRRDLDAMARALTKRKSA